MATEIVQLRHPDEFPPDVALLFEEGQRDSIALGSRWFRNFIDTVAQDEVQVCFHVLRRDGHALVALPVLERRAALHRGVEALGNYYTALYAPLVHREATAQDVAELLREVRRSHAPMASLRLQPMDPQSRAWQVLLPALRLASLRPFTFFCFQNFFLRAPPDWASFLAQRNSKMRSNIKRMEKKLAQEGGRVEIVVDPTECERGIDAYLQVYERSWKRDEPYPRFMPGLIRHAAEEGWLRLGLAWLDGRPIAAQVWLVANRKADIYKVAYDEAFKEYSPGTVLTAHLMQHVIEHDGVAEVDFLIGDDAYKKNWMSDCRERWGVIAYNPATPAGAFGAAREALARMLKPAWLRLRGLRPIAR